MKLSIFYEIYLLKRQTGLTVILGLTSSNDNMMGLGSSDGSREWTRHTLSPTQKMSNPTIFLSKVQPCPVTTKFQCYYLFLRNSLFLKQCIIASVQHKLVFLGKTHSLLRVSLPIDQRTLKRHKQMQCGILGWPMEQINDSSGKISEIQIQPIVQLAVLFQHCLVSINVRCGLLRGMLTSRELGEGHTETLYCLWNSSANLVISQ